jgi:tRNA (guanine-N7-)-methyltransferase
MSPNFHCSIVENPVRTSQFLAMMEQRRLDLRQLVAAIFPRACRFVCEFGCGHGHFLAAYAQRHPTKLCIGLDIDRERIARATRKRERANSSNLHFIQSEASLFLETLPDDARFADIFILFPDPWPKKRHHKNRLIQPDFLSAIHRRAGEETRIYFRTDHEQYYADARSVFEQHAGWQVVDEPWPFEHETVFQNRAASYRSLTARPRLTPEICAQTSAENPLVTVGRSISTKDAP